MRGVDVWFAREALLDDAKVAARLSALLAPDERARHDRMVQPSGRRQQLLARGMQREVLSRYQPQISPADWRFERSAGGRPALAAPFAATGLHFNLAHTAGMVVMAVGCVPLIGVDVEALDKRAPLPLAQRYFSAREAAALDALPPEARPRRFLRLWTLKEAYLKALGEGLPGGLERMTFTLDGGAGIGFEHDDDSQAARWSFHEFSLDGFLVALAYLDPAAVSAAEVRLREYPAANT
jgi:4'-phosphopantetheinyl transferase